MNKMHGGWRSKLCHKLVLSLARQRQPKQWNAVKQMWFCFALSFYDGVAVTNIVKRTMALN